VLNPNEQTDGQPPQIGRVTAGLVDWCRRYAWLVVALSVAAAAILGEIVSDRISIDTDTDRLLSEKLPWREREIAFDKEFPQNSNLIAVVIDGSTPEQAESATAALAAKLAAAPDLFTSVVRPDGGPFFDRNGLLLLPIADVQSLADAMIAAQGLLGNIAADPSLRGLTNTLTLALQGVNQGATDRAALAPALTAISGAIEANLNPQSPVLPLSWQSMLTGRKPSSTDLRRFIQAKPVMDFSSLTPGARATDFIRKTAADLGFVPANGVTIHLTGDVPLNDEQFATVTEGLGISMAVALTLVALLLYGALRSVRMAAAILVTLIVGLTGTAAFATIIGPLNLISVAFAILFVGIAVDFGIQFSVRYRAQRNRIDDFAVALKDTGRLVGPALALAALAAASGFFSFLPTAYRGVSELGIIAGVGMVIAVFFNLTLLPALLTLFHLGPEPRPVGFAALAGLDRFLVRRRRPVLAATAVLALGAAALLPGLRFDFNPLNLMDPHAEAVSTILQLMKDPNTTPNTIDVLKPSLDDAVKAADRLGKLPEVSRAVTLASYVPEDQPQKLAILHDAETLIGPTLDPATIMPPPDHEAMRSALANAAAALRSAAPAGATASPELRLAALFDKVGASPDSTLDRIQFVLLSGLTDQLRGLRLILSATPVTLADLPAELTRSWIAPNGQARAEIFPAGNAADNAVLKQFVTAVTAIEPDAVGTPVSIQESSRTIVGAFETAGLLATLGITVLLAVTLRRAHDVVLALAPLLLAALFTLATTVLIGMPLNFANIIALPLLLGIGVAFDIYFVMNWRAGRPNPLQSGTARAIVFSALTTTSAFGSLILSSHPGTSEMGRLLSIEMFYTLFCVLLIMPALLGPPRARNTAPASRPRR
jgi:hopanoid biosynthesis associated RND transporter like protein HpnN